MIAAFAPGLGCAFTNWDDNWLVVENPWIQRGDVSAAATILDWNAPREVRLQLGGEYLPARDFSYMADVAVWGLNPVGFHLTSLGLHLLAVLALAAAAWRVTRNGAFALALAAVFALHPVQVESVTWISSRKGVLAAALGAFGALCWAVFRDRRNRSAYAGSLACLAVAMTAKYTAVVWPVLLMAVELVAPPPRAGGVASRRDRRWWLLPHLVVVLAFTGLIAIPIGREVGLIRPYYGSGFGATVLTAGAVICDYARLICWPWPLQTAVDYPIVGDTQPVLGWIATLLVAALGLTAAAATVAAARRPGRGSPAARIGALAVVWFLVALAPTSNIVSPIGTLFSERYLYLPMLGVGIGLAAPAAWAWPRRRQGAGRTVLGVLGGVALVWMVLTGVRTRAWNGSEAIWRDVLQRDPAHHTAYVNLARHRVDRARTLPLPQRNAELDQAIRLLDAGLVRTHRSLFTVPERAWVIKGVALTLRGDFDGAVAAYDKALQAARYGVLAATFAQERATRTRFQAVILDGRGQARDKSGDAPGAEQDFRAALAIDPRLPSAHLNLGLVVARRAGTDAPLLDEATEHLQTAATLNPVDPEPQLNLAVLYSRRGYLHRAVTTLDALLAREPTSAEARFYRGIVLSNAGRTGEAEALFQNMAAEPDPAARARGALGQGRLHEARGEFQRALAVYQRALLDPAIRNTVHEIPIKDRMGGMFLDAANKLIKDEKLEEAIRYLEAAARVEAPGAKSAATKAALAAGADRLEKGTPADLQAAEKLFLRALKIDATCVEAHLGIAAVGREQKDPRKVADALSEALAVRGISEKRRRRVRLEGGGFEAARALLFWNAGGGDLAKARAALSNAEKLAPEGAPVLRAIAQIESGSGEDGDADRAVRAAEKLVQVLDPPTLGDLGLIVRVFSEAAGAAAKQLRGTGPKDPEREILERRRLDFLARAIRWQNRYVKRKPDNAQAWRNIANLLKSYGDLPKAVQAYTKGMALDPKDRQMADEAADVHRTLGLRLYAHWRHEADATKRAAHRTAAIGHLERWIALAHPAPDARGRQVLAEMRAQDPSGDAVEQLVTAGWRTLKAGDLDAALELARQARARGGSRSTLLLAAECWFRRGHPGDLDDAVDTWDHALVLLWDEGLAVRMGNALWDAERWDEAIKRVDTALGRLDAPDRPELVNDWLYGRRGQAAAQARALGAAAMQAAKDGDRTRLMEAERQFRRVVRFRPRDPRGHLGLAQAYEALSDPELARGGYRRVLELLQGDGSAAAESLRAAAKAGLGRVGR